MHLTITYASCAFISLVLALLLFSPFWLVIGLILLYAAHRHNEYIFAQNQ